MTKDEAWEMIDSALDHSYSETDVTAIREAITAIREALAQPAPDCKETGVCVQTGLACFGQAAQPAPVQELVTHTINATHTAAVATDYYWIPIDGNTPRGVKLQLLGNGGVAAYGNYQGAPFWSHWAPLPKREAE